MSTIVNINPCTSEINITPKEGFEIDLENSDLKNGKVLFKEVEKKYPTEFKNMEYLTIEEKASLTGYFILIDEHIKNCQSIGVDAEYWENQKVIFQKAYDKITKNLSL